MCGIIGILGKEGVVNRLVDGLRRLEYRGYDSAGIAVIRDGAIERRRAIGKLDALVDVLHAEPLDSLVGIGHTRWATHGAATVANAHPHDGDGVVLVHNGIIENFAELRAMLSNEGVSFDTETDSEVVAKLVAHEFAKDHDPHGAVARALGQVVGAYALAILFENVPDLIIVARQGSPLAIGEGDGEAFVGSDAQALGSLTNKITYLNDGDIALVRRERVEIFDGNGAQVERPQKIVTTAESWVDKGGFRHFMAKEIRQQPEVVGRTIAHYVDAASGRMSVVQSEFDFAAMDRLTISACGTAFYAGLLARYWFETLANLPVEIDIASELRYRKIPYTDGGGALFISQSGETADTLAALRNARECGQKIAAIVNVTESTIAREADVIYPTLAGPEIGVASTKAFSCQLAVCASLAIAAGIQRGVLSQSQASELIGALLAAPRLIGESIAADPIIETLAQQVARKRDILFIGRGVSFPMAMEGALKLKEISYIHAEGYAAGELKHGPIALIDQDTPVIAVAPSDEHFKKTVSNVHEVIARGAQVILLSDAQGVAATSDDVAAAIEVPKATHPLLAPFAVAAPLQLLAYHTAAAKGTDIDQPRNLAKSVTVE